MKWLGSLLALLVLLSATSASAQSTCRAFSEGLGAKNKAVEDELEAVKKLRGRRPENCAAARKLLETARALHKQINDAYEGALCSSLPDNDTGKIFVRFERASASFKATLAETEADRLCP